MKVLINFKWMVIVIVAIVGCLSFARFAKASQVAGTGIVSKKTGMCLTVYWDTNGAPVVQSPCSYPLQTHQLWYQGSVDGGGNSRQIVNWATGKCLEVPANHSLNANGARIQIWDCHDEQQRNQFWDIQRLEHEQDGHIMGFWQMINKASGKCLDAPAEFTQQDGVQMQQWDCLGQQQWNQLWGDADPVPDFLLYPTEYLIISVNSGKCLDVEGSSTKAHAQVIQFTCHQRSNQRWIFRQDGTIQNVNSELCLDIAGAFLDNHIKLQQFPCHGQSNQRFTLHWGENTALLQAQHSLKCLDVPGDSLDNAIQIQQFDCHNGLNQLWFITPIS